MKATTIISAFKWIGILSILLGLVVLGVVTPSMTPKSIQIIIAIVSILVMIIGYLLYKKANDIGKKYYHMNKMPYEYIITTLLIFGAVSQILLPLTSMQVSEPECDTTYCPVFKDRIIAIEYIVTGLTAITGLLAFGTLIFGRTVLGPVMQEIQPMAGMMTLVLLLLFFLVVPLHVVFQDCTTTVSNGWGNTQEKQGCYINVCNLQHNGPMLLRWIMKMISIPGYGCG